MRFFLEIYILKVFKNKNIKYSNSVCNVIVEMIIVVQNKNFMKNKLENTCDYWRISVALHVK